MHEIVSPLLVNNARYRPTHWALPYIGLPYEDGSRGPETYDCWGLIWKVYREQYKITLPEYPGITFASHQFRCGAILFDIAQNWIEVQKPFDGCGVAMSQRTVIHHVGVYIEADGGKILHAMEGMGVVAMRINDLRFRGFRVIKYYRHRLWPIS